MQLSDRVALITGGSRGLGLALAHELGRAGAKLALIARDGAALERAVDQLAAAGIAALGVAADVGDKNAVYPSLGRIQAVLGPIDILIHNASTLGPTPLVPLVDTECETLAHTLEVNVVGPFRFDKALAPAMALRGGGLIAHISSDAAVNAYPNWGAYGSAKAALDHLARTLAAEFAGSGVRVLAIDPGEMDTDMHRAALPDADPETLERPAEVARRIARIFRRPDLYPSGARVIASEIDAHPSSRPPPHQETRP
jgi:NAD(P)-dependent dehydrogenase (short-subunit alcohol dehydrogenase family)